MSNLILLVTNLFSEHLVLTISIYLPFSQFLQLGTQGSIDTFLFLQLPMKLTNLSLESCFSLNIKMYN
jgi:hypothetical protein